MTRNSAAAPPEGPSFHVFTKQVGGGKALSLLTEAPWARVGLRAPGGPTARSPSPSAHMQRGNGCIAGFVRQLTVFQEPFLPYLGPGNSAQKHLVPTPSPTQRCSRGIHL